MSYRNVFVWTNRDLGCNSKLNMHKPCSAFQECTKCKLKDFTWGKGHLKTATSEFHLSAVTQSHGWAISNFYLLSIIWCLLCFELGPLIKNASVSIMAVTHELIPTHDTLSPFVFACITTAKIPVGKNMRAFQHMASLSVWVKKNKWETSARRLIKSISR